jgi:hypothetical protein
MELDERILTKVRERAGDATPLAELASKGITAERLEAIAVQALELLGVPVSSGSHAPPLPKDLDHHGARDYQSLLLHFEAVRLLEQDPNLVARALETLARRRETIGPHSLPLFNEWRTILEQRAWPRALARDEHGNQLRRASPFAGLLPEETRLGILGQVNALKALDAVHKILGELPVGSKLMFFFNPKGSLSGRTPLEALLCGQLAKVKATAAAFADQR